MQFLKWSSPRALLFPSAVLLGLGCGSGAVDYGAPCSETVACSGGLACVTAFPDGYCSSRCGSGVACAPGGVCDPSVGGGLCLESCATADDCRDGYQCWRGGCRPACSVDSECGGGDARCIDGQCTGPECSVPEDCGPGRTCAGGACVEAGVDAGMPDTSGAIGDGMPCTSSDACASGICLPPERGGICTRACTDASSCFDAVTFVSACAPVILGGTQRTLCVPFSASGLPGSAACSADSQCASGLCAAGLCSEACDDATDCTFGERCTSLSWTGGTFMGCGYPARSGAVETLELDLGTRTIAAGSGTIGLEVGVPADAISITLRAQRVSGDPIELAFYDVFAPDGDSLYDLGDFSDFIDQTIRWYPGDGTEAITMFVPNTTADRFAFQVGRYRYGVLAFGDPGSGLSASVRISALVKRAAGSSVSSGSLDVAVHLVGIGVTSAAAPSNSRVQAILSRMGTVLSQVGISLGTVTYHDVSDSTLAVIDSVDGPTSELAALFRRSAGRTGNVLPLFLVRGIEAGGDGFNTLGIAGGIPGATAIYGTNNSGVVVSFDMAYIGSGAAAGHVAAHESGHFLGLFHVTERLRACGAGETPAPGVCVPFGSTDVIADTTRGDTANLMNWSIVGGGTNDDLSAGQGFVLLRSPLVR